MKNKLLIQQFNTKFVQSTIYSKINDTSIFSSILENNLYKTYYMYNPTHIILVADALTNEYIQFISDFCNSKKIFIYHKNLSNINLKLLQNYTVTHIVHEPIIETGYEYILYDNNTINNQLFFDDSTLSKNESIICFLDNIDSIQKDLTAYLYPHSKLPIKLFNNPKINHCQNLGLLTELDKALLLKTNKYYLSIDTKQDYSLEARACGAIVLTTNDLKNYTSVNKSTDKNNIKDHITFIKESILL